MLLHAIMIAASTVFLFPFLWMMCNSMKVKEEMTGDNFRLLPTTPHVTMLSPYFDAEEFEPAGVAEGIPAAVWKEARPDMELLIRRRLETWTPVLPGEETPVEIAPENSEACRAAMVRGIIATISARISDRARNAAGKKAIVAEIDRLLTPEICEEVLDRTFQRICLGGVKFRGGRRIRNGTSEQGWRLEQGDASLISRRFNGAGYRMVHADYRSQPELCFVYTPQPADASGIDRIFVSYRGDASWARVGFEVIRDGKRYRTSDVVNLYHSGWTEAILEWDTGDRRPSGANRVCLLREAGSASPGSPGFELRMTVKKSGRLTAWCDKALRNYRIVFKEIPFARYIMTSFALCILNIVLAVFSCTFVAYGFARLEWPGRDLFFGLMIATMMVPAQVVMLPNFLINRALGFYNTLFPLWLYSAFGSAFFIFLLRQFMKTIPKSLEEAAMIDGCGFLGIYWHVILPLVKPTVATIAIYTFTGCWNNFMGPLIYVNDESLFPLALGLFKFNLVSGSDTGLMMAGSFLMTLPVILLFFFAQKYFIQGITLTGTKE